VTFLTSRPMAAALAVALGVYSHTGTREARTARGAVDHDRPGAHYRPTRHERMRIGL